MIRSDMIPPDAMYAAWKAMNAGMTLNDAIAAALNAWLGSELEHDIRKEPRTIHLPIPEASDD